MRKRRSCGGVLAAEPRIVIAGAGAIGCFVGGLLAAGGRRVTLLVRPRVAQEIRSHGLTLTDFGGMAVQIGTDRLALSEDPACLARADVVLVTVKSGDTATIAELIDQHAPIKAPVISLQNGLRNGALLQEALPGHDVRGGMVPFNVVPMGQGCYHRATSGDVVIAGGAGDLEGLLSVPHLSTASSRDIEAVQWGKFLINLNNALNALSGLPSGGTAAGSRLAAADGGSMAGGFGHSARCGHSACVYDAGFRRGHPVYSAPADATVFANCGVNADH